jgi:hypothetical protein
MVKVCLRPPHHLTSHPNPNHRPRAWTSSTRKQTIPTTLPWTPKRSCPFSTVSSVSGVPRHTPCISLTPFFHPLDEAFAAKHMPDLGHDVKEFQVSHWKLQGWKKLEKKLTGPEFDCGGHKWCALTSYRPLPHLRNLKTRPGGYFSSRSAILTLPRMIPSLSISITPTPRA